MPDSAKPNDDRGADEQWTRQTTVQRPIASKIDKTRGSKRRQNDCVGVWLETGDYEAEHQTDGVEQNEYR